MQNQSSLGGALDNILHYVVLLTQLTLSYHPIIPHRDCRRESSSYLCKFCLTRIRQWPLFPRPYEASPASTPNSVECRSGLGVKEAYWLVESQGPPDGYADVSLLHGSGASFEFTVFFKRPWRPLEETQMHSNGRRGLRRGLGE